MKTMLYGVVVAAGVWFIAIYIALREFVTTLYMDDVENKK